MTICIAEIDADEIVLEDVVVEHVLGSFAEVDDPLRRCGAGRIAEGYNFAKSKVAQVAWLSRPIARQMREVMERASRGVFAFHERRS